MSEDIDFYQLLAGPILAANEAQAGVAANFVEQVYHFAFADGGTGTDTEGRDLRMVRFLADGGIDQNGRPTKQEIAMPLLQLVPLSGLMIDNARIEFTCEVNAQPPRTVEPSGPATPIAEPAAKATTGNTGAPPQAAAPASLPLGRRIDQPARIVGRIAPSKPAGESAGNLKVEINLVRADLPSGFLDFLASTHATARHLPAAADPPSADTPEAPSDDPPSPEPVVSDDLFSASIAAMDGDHLLRGEASKLTVAIEPNRDAIPDGTLEIDIVADPDSDLKILEPVGGTGIGPRNRKIPVLLYVSKTSSAASRRAASFYVIGKTTDANGLVRIKTTEFQVPVKK